MMMMMMMVFMTKGRFFYCYRSLPLVAWHGFSLQSCIIVLFFSYVQLFMHWCPLALDFKETTRFFGRKRISQTKEGKYLRRLALHFLFLCFVACGNCAPMGECMETRGPLYFLPLYTPSSWESSSTTKKETHACAILLCVRDNRFFSIPNLYWTSIWERMQFMLGLLQWPCSFPTVCFVRILYRFLAPSFLCPTSPIVQEHNK